MRFRMGGNFLRHFSQRPSAPKYTNIGLFAGRQSKHPDVTIIRTLSHRNNLKMSNSKRSSRKRLKRKFLGRFTDFSNRVGLSPMRMFFTLLLLGGIGYVIYLVGFPNADAVVEKPKVISENSRLLLELTTDQELERILNESFTNNENFLVIIDRMNGHEKSLDDIESRIDLTEEQHTRMERLRIRNKSVIVMMLIKNKISSDAEKADLREYCLARLRSSDHQISEASQFWLALLPVLEFTGSPSEETLQNFEKAIIEYRGGYLNSPDNSASLANLVSRIKDEHPGKKDFSRRAFLMLAEQMSKSEVPRVRTIASQVDGLSVFGEYDLQTLEQRIVWSDPIADEQLSAAMDTLSKNTDAPLQTWTILIKAYEAYLATDRIEEAGAAWQRMWELSSGLADQNKKATLQGLLKRQRVRAMFIGQKFDVLGTKLVGGQPFDAKKSDYYAVIFCDKEVNSLKALATLGKEALDQPLKYSAIVSFSEKLTEVDINSLHKVPRGISITAQDTAKKHFSAFPADFLPYVLLVDKSEKVIAVNVDLKQINNRVARSEAQRQRAREMKLEEAPAESR